MSVSNHERITKAMDLLKEGLHPFIERELRAAYGEKWADASPLAALLQKGSGRTAQKVHWDVPRLLAVMWDVWQPVFSKTLGHAERSLASELREFRNRWAHQQPFSTDDTHRVMDSAARLLTAVSAPQAEELERMKQELLRARFEEQARKESRKSAEIAVEGQPASGLKPWREVITPHPDVASGRYQQAEFAADLWQVYLGQASGEYQDPPEFFRRTYLTDGLKQLLIGALRRLSGTGGDPVVELQTNFGGGKTHSMLALYHLISKVSLGKLPGLEPVLEESGVSALDKTRCAVLVGTRIQAGAPSEKPDGTVTRTLWGELAWQLGGKEGYALVQQADKTGTNPGDALRLLFNKYAPCLILIDEWVAYARQLYSVHDLPAGTFDTHFTFAQTLSEAAKTASKTLLVVSIPASDNEIGGEGGRMALERLKNAIGRVESPWRPASTEESFEIVRRRLFEPITDPRDFVARDAVVKAFADLYRTQSQEFPLECKEADYRRRMEAAYPVHPELFDRLHNDWSSLDRFQRTRGVLRLLASVIHTLWEREDKSLLIMPATVPMDASSVQSELTRYLVEQSTWHPVIDKDIDSSHSLPHQLDRSNPNLGRYSACRRVARTVYMGSAPIQQAANRGLEQRQIVLGCVQPGESVATFNDALRRLTDQAAYLYVDGRRYWYSTQPSVTRLADDRAAQQDAHKVHEEIKKRLKVVSSERGGFTRVVIAPSSHSDVPDEQEVQLVVLSPDYCHTTKMSGSPAGNKAVEILEWRGNTPRNHRNMLVFLALDKARLADLEAAVRLFLAWKSIEGEREALNLDAFQTNQAKTKCQDADSAVNLRMPEAYAWLLVPGQEKPDSHVEWQEFRLSGQDSLATRAYRKLQTEDLLITKLAPTLLRQDLDRIPLWRGDHVSLKQLVEDFCKYLYLSRLRDPQVLLESIKEGVSMLTWATDTFAYAEGWDETKSRYRGLLAARHASIAVDAHSLLVKPDVAGEQLKAETPQAPSVAPPSGKSADGESDPAGASDVGPISGESVPPPPPAKPRRFYGSVELHPTRVGRDAGKIAEEVIQHLSSLIGANIEVSLEIRAQIQDGVPDQTMRTVTENCRTLRFKTHGFEDE